MSRRRSRVIAVQALVVGALALVVVLTVLRPEGDEPLFGVTTPEENTERVEVTPRDPDRDRDRDAPAERRRGGGEEGRDLALTDPARPGAGLRAEAGGYVGPAGSTQATPLAPGSAPAGSGESTPTGDQYADSLARLAAKLH